MKKNNLLIVILMSSISLSYGQTSFSIAEAIDYSIKNNNTIKNAQLGIESANQKVRETTGIGLPQVSASGQFQNFIDIPISVLPGNALNPAGDPNELIALQFGTNYTANGALSVNQLLFSGSYIVGLQTSKTYKAVSEYQKDKSIIDTKELVMKAYYGVLVADKTVQSLKEISATSDKIYKETKAIFAEGLIEEDNVTQLSLNVLNSKNALANAKRQLENAKNVLKLQMGYDFNQDINLTSDFESVVVALTPENTEVTSDINQNIDFMLLNKQLELSKLNVKYEQSQYLPTLSAFLNHQQNALRNDFDFLQSGNPWFPTTIWGLNLSVPIFTGGQ
ncbi:MAG: TolC family protein, partial [Flavobacteriales bacterium]